MLLWIIDYPVKRSPDAPDFCQETPRNLKTIMRTIGRFVRMTKTKQNEIRKTEKSKRWCGYELEEERIPQKEHLLYLNSKSVSMMNNTIPLSKFRSEIPFGRAVVFNSSSLVCRRILIKTVRKS